MMRAVEALIDAGLGLDRDELRLRRSTEAWVGAGSALRDHVAETLADADATVEPIGSSSVLGLLAKPIVDLAVGRSEQSDFALVRRRLEAAGWIYRGDAGDDGGHLFVLEARPGHRIAHLHVVDHGGAQWCDYLRLRDRLRRSSAARSEYEAAKLQLVEQFGDDRTSYTDGKSEIICRLLGEGERT